MRLKTKRNASVFLILSTLPLLFLFQNCAKPADQESILSSLDDASQIDQNHDADTVAKKEATSSLLMNRKVIYSLFVDILGPMSSQIAPLTKLKNDKAVFGAPCSVYDNFKSARANGAPDVEADPCTNSADSNQLGSSIEASGNSLQEALVNDICVRSTENTAAFEYVMVQLRDVPTVMVPVSSDNNILKLISLFYRGKPKPHDGLLKAMQTVIGTPVTADGWKRAFITTCTSAHWQVL